MKTVQMSLLVIGMVSSLTHAAVVVDQLNTALDQEPGGQWSVIYDPYPRITIMQAHPNEAYVFYSHEEGSSTLRPIEEIKRSLLLTTGTIRLMVSGNASYLTAGASEVKAITIDEEGNDQITSYIEGIETTDDFLTTQAMTVNGDLGSAVTIQYR